MSLWQPISVIQSITNGEQNLPRNQSLFNNNQFIAFLNQASETWSETKNSLKVHIKTFKDIFTHQRIFLEFDDITAIRRFKQRLPFLSKK